MSKKVAQLGAVEGWSVTQWGETLKTVSSEIEAWNWLLDYQSSSIDWAMRNEGYDIVQIKDGKVVYSSRRDNLQKNITRAVAGRMDKERAAEVFEESVQEAFIKVYGFPKDIRNIGRAIKSSFLKPGKKLRWTEPHPNVVLILTEVPWISKPFASQEDYKKWNEVGTILRAMGWPNASTDSINPSVQMAYWRP